MIREAIEEYMSALRLLETFHACSAAPRKRWRKLA